MEDIDLVSVVDREVRAAIGQWSGELSTDRARELDYYNSEPFGNEVEGESQVVSSDVFDTVEGILPSLLRIFTASDDVVRFEPNGPEDEDAAKQQTEVCNYIFYRQNNGFLILYEWFKDALIQKNGIVKYWWEEKESKTKEEYKGLSEAQFQKLADDKDTKILEHTERADEDAEAELKTKFDGAVKQLDAQAQQAVGNPQALMQMAQMRQQMQQQYDSIKVPNLHDVKISVTKDVSKICIEAVPPEEFGISSHHKSTSIQDAPFCYHKSKKTISYLREMGCPESVIDEIGGGENDGRDFTPETLARDSITDQQSRPETTSDESMRQVWVTDCFLRVDFDGDGVAELRHIIKAGNAIWINEETDHINFASLTPIIMPHRWVGKSAAELVMADQFTKSVIWRQILNNLYLTNNPRKAVLSSSSGVAQANLDDLMNSRAGGIMREYVTGAIRSEDVPFVAGASFPMLQYIDAQKETRTGVSRYNQGTDADSLNKTARGIQMIQDASQQRIDLIARVFAETGVKDLMRGIAYMLSRYSSKAMTIRLRNKWVEVDPRNWKTQYDMSINVGLGSGNKDVQLAHLSAMGAKQIELMQTGKGYLVSDENVYNLYQKTAEAMGFKHPEIFVSDPKTVEKPQPQPDPAMMKIQAESEADKAKIQSNQQTRMFDAQTQKELAQFTSNAQMQLAQLAAQTQKELEQMRSQHQSQMEMFKANNELRDSGDKNQQAREQFEFDKQLEIDKARLDIELQKMKMDSDGDVDMAIQKVQNLVIKHEAKMSSMIEIDAAKRTESAKGEVVAHEESESAQSMATMHQQFIESVGQIIEALQSKKKVSMTMPDGRTATAEVATY